MWKDQQDNIRKIDWGNGLTVQEIKLALMGLGYNIKRDTLYAWIKKGQLVETYKHDGYRKKRNGRYLPFWMKG